MRFLTFSNCPLDERLGSGYVILNYCRGLRQLGHEVDLLGPTDYEPLRDLGRGIQYRQALGMAAHALRRVASRSYDVVEFYGAESWLAVWLLHRLPGRRFLLVCHSNGLETHCEEVLREVAGLGYGAPGRRWYHLDQSRLFARGFRSADALVVVSEFDRRYALKQGYGPPERVLAVENPLSDHFLGFEPPSRRERIIGFCGSWLPIKGVQLLTQAVPALLRALPGWRFFLVGVGSDFHPGGQFPSDVLPRVHVVPHAERQGELRELFSRFSILVMPSLYESFHLAAAEAMACGCALVANRVGLAADLVDGEEAVTLDRPSATELCAATRRLAVDEELRSRIARGGYHRVQGLHWEVATERLASAYVGWSLELRRKPVPSRSTTVIDD